MSRTDVYEHILQELADGELDELEAKVFHFLRRVYPAPMTRRDLLECLFGYRPGDEEDINNNTDDRKIRTAIASLFDKGVPVVSTSGGAGYRIDINLDSWTELVNELRGKKETYEKKLDAAHRIVERITLSGREAIPSDAPVKSLRAVELEEGPRQLALMEVDA